MKSFFTIIKYDYLQRTRSYAFLITLCLTLGVAYTFVPGPNANYSTIHLSNYQGFYNSDWIAYVTAIMTSSFLSLIGFYLVNNSIKKDIDTKVGQIVATTQVGNFKYLLSKVLSNFLVLISIVFVVFLMSIMLFFKYNTDFSFDMISFVKPYLFITIPTMFFIAVLAVLFEVFLGKYSILQNVGFFFLFAAIISISNGNEKNYSLDVTGIKIVTTTMNDQVNKTLGSEVTSGLGIGYMSKSKDVEIKRFAFNGIDFPNSFLISRILIILFGIGIIGIIAPFFHRFDRKKRVKHKAKKETVIETKLDTEIRLINLPKVQENFGILPFIKTELLLLFRNGKKGLWILNLIGMVLLIVTPVEIALQFILPIVWFFQVSRLSSLTTKEVTNNVHYFAFASYKPLSRLLLSQIISGVLLMLFIALPLLVKLLFIGNLISVVTVFLGGMFIVLLATTFGILTGSKKLFEVLFFMLTYANINGVSFLDYFGGTTHNSTYIVKLVGFILFLMTITFLKRKMDLENN